MLDHQSALTAQNRTASSISKTRRQKALTYLLIKNRFERRIDLIDPNVGPGGRREMVGVVSLCVNVGTLAVYWWYPCTTCTHVTQAAKH